NAFSRIPCIWWLILIVKCNHRGHRMHGDFSMLFPSGALRFGLLVRLFVFGTWLTGQMQTLAEIMKLLFGCTLDREYLFLDFHDRLRIRFLDLLGQPEPLDNIEDDNSRHHYKEQSDTDLLKI